MYCESDTLQASWIIRLVSSPIDPDISPPGLDTGEKRLVDGAGNAGPVRVRLTFVYPNPGAQIDPARPVGGVEPDGDVFHFRAEVCMDAVPNPQNNPLLSAMRVRGYWSADGIRPIPIGTTPTVNGAASISVSVRNGTCVTYQRIPAYAGGTPGQQLVYFSPPGARYLILTARHGSDQEFSSFNQFPDAACPAPDAVGSSRPGCVFRSAHFLDYRW
jgi:hypothetical protein